MAGNTHIAAFWGVTPYDVAEGHKRLGRKHHLHIYYCPECEGSSFARNFDARIPDYCSIIASLAL
jgi:hypothetical protein